MENKIRLGEDDWRQLFPPRQAFRLGSIDIYIDPIGTAEAFQLARIVGAILKKLQADPDAISRIIEGFNQLQRIESHAGEITEVDVHAGFSVFRVLADAIPLFGDAIRDAVPEIMEVLSGVDRVDIARIPPTVLVDLATVCVMTNVEANRDLLGKLRGLIQAGKTDRTLK